MMRLPFADYDLTGEVLEAVPLEDLTAVADLLWRSHGKHPDGASCECPAFEAVGGLLRLGYTLRKDTDDHES